MAESQKMVKKIKCVVVGAIFVGKTSLIRRYVTHKFSTDLSATLGMDISVSEPPELVENLRSLSQRYARAIGDAEGAGAGNCA